MRGGTCCCCYRCCSHWHFNPLTPCGVGPGAITLTRGRSTISIHPPRAGWDMLQLSNLRLWERFQSTHPMWGGTRLYCTFCRFLPFQSTHPMWGGTNGKDRVYQWDKFQSTHPMWGGTLFRMLESGAGGHFNPPTPCGVGRVREILPLLSILFQSTHPMRGGTAHGGPSLPQNPYFNPPTPCGVGLIIERRGQHNTNFNPPTPCGVGLRFALFGAREGPFQSTHPMWGGTGSRIRRIGRSANFNPPTPCGVGQDALRRPLPCYAFQSTHPMWGGTPTPPLYLSSFSISIHPPHVGWDITFQLPSPLSIISIHPPHVGWDPDPE